MFIIKKIFNRLKLTLSIVILVTFFFGCLNSEPPPPPQQIDTSTDQQKEAITQESTNEFVNNTGIVLEDLTIKPKGSLGGDVIINVKNTSSEDCTGLMINVDLVSDTGNVIVSLGLKSPKTVPPSGSETLKEGYIGKGATEVVVTALTCDASILGDTSGDAGGKKEKGGR